MFGFFYTLYHTGLRFNDLYDISRMTIHKDIVSVQPSKKNNTRIIEIEKFHPQTLSFIKNQINFYYQFASYRTYTRTFNKLSANQFFVKLKPTSLHLFRHNYVRKLYFYQHKSLPGIQEILGLKSLDIVSDYVFGEIKIY
jgi:integrase